VRLLFGLILAGLIVAFLIEIAAVGGAWMLHRDGRIDDEIAWLERMRPLLVWDRTIDSQIDKLYRDRIEQALLAGRIEPAVQALRLARAHAGNSTKDPKLVSLGIETFTRASDKVQQMGRLSRAADWDDSLFVFAIRAPEPRHRYAALAAFTEGLDLRVRDSQPCAALARVEWAKRGLGGEVPGMANNVEEDLAVQCNQTRRHGGVR